MSEKLKIIFLNHASFIIQFKNTKVLVDPYLFGEAFNNGWNLLKEFNHANQLDDITHIFYSHEHPDHFSIPFLKKIDENDRKKITIIYQNTFDKKVKKFCEKLGYKFREFEDSIEERLDEAFCITIGKNPFFDSWINFNVDNRNILNVNDSVLENPDLVLKIKKKLNRKIDALFSQFSYAEYLEEGQQKLQATKQLESIKLQDKILEPKYIIPFASFIYYSHIENKLMNKNINKLDNAYKFINNNCNAHAVILKPNEIWYLDKKDNQNSVKFWNTIYDKIDSLNFHKLTKQLNENQLQEKCKKYIRKINSLNNKYLIRLLLIFTFFTTIKIYVKDLNKFFKFNIGNGLTVTNETEGDFLQLSSESLAFIFDYDFGYDTLLVNARFSASQNYLSKISRCFVIGTLNNTGRYVKFLDFFKFMNLNFFIRGLEVTGLKSRKN